MIAGSFKEFRNVIVIFLFGCYVAFGQNCGGDHVSTDSEQEITYPGVDGPVECQWVIQTTELNSYIRLTVTTLVLPESPDCERHRIEIWADGFTSDDEDAEMLCGTGVGTWTYFLSTGQRMLVRFVSAGRNAGESIDFLLSYITVEEVEPKLIWTDREPTEGRVRVHTLPADPNAYILSGTISTKYYYQHDAGHWLAIANDRRERTIFWSDAVNKQIIRGSIGRHSAAKAVFIGVSNEVQGLAVDWMAKNVYLTDALYNWILVMNYDASIVFHIVTTGLDVPRAIAVHPRRSYLFWTDCGNHPRIERSNLAGGERRVLIDSQLTSPNGITVDFQSQRIFWSNAGPLANSIESSLFDGGDRETLFSVSSSGAQFYHVTTFQDYVFVADQVGHIRCARKSIPGEEYFSLNLGAEVYGITIYDTDSQAAVESPCSSNPCSHICVGSVVEPHYKCMCPNSRSLLADARTCGQKLAVSSPALFVAGTSKLCEFPSNYPTMVIESNYELSCFLTGRQHAVALAVDVKDQMLFFSDVSTKLVSAVLLTADSRTVTLTGVTKSVEGIAVDWISNNVYWTDNPAGKISVSTYDGQHQKDLITTDVIRPRAIAVEPFTKYMFWGEFGEPAQIERSDLDGNNRRVIISEEITLPNGLTIDYSQQRLYFADSVTGAIDIVGYDGQDRVTLLQRQAPLTHNFFGMTLYQDFILWTEFGAGNGIYVANRNTGEMVREHLVHETGVYGLTMYANFSQPEGDGPCLVDNGGCNQLCLPSSTASGGRVCQCTFGFNLDDDSMTCVARVVEDNFVLFTDTFLRRVFQVDLSDPNYITNGLALGPMSNPIAVSYDPEERMVYWSDVVDHSINRAGLDGSGSQRIIYGNIQVPDGLTVDPVGRLLFWTDKGNKTISVAMLTGERQTTLITDGLENPRAIALHTEEGYMYWTDWGTEPKIERSFMDGSQRETLITTDLGWPNGLTVDTQGRKLYWGEAQVDTIEVADLDGQNRRILIDFSTNAHPYGIGTFGPYVFWTDWSEASLMRADKITGENVVSVGPSGLVRPNELHIYNSDIPAQGHASCTNQNGRCAGICLPSVLGRTCHCGDEGSLEDDGVSCSARPDGTGLLGCPLAFEAGELEAGCTGITGVVCSVSCWTGFRNRVTSIVCQLSGEWNEDLNTVCEVENIGEDPGELTVTVYISDVTPAIEETLEVFCEVNDDSTEISWYKDGNLLESSTIKDLHVLENSLLIVQFDYIHQGQYACSAHRERDGKMAEAVLAIHLPVEELFERVPENTTIDEYANGILRCIPQNPLHSVFWEKDGLQLEMNEHVTDGIQDTLIFTDVRLEESGLYTCVLKLGDQRVAKASAKVTVNVTLEIDEVCGTITADGVVNIESSPDGRIVGGHKAIYGSAPWMVRLYDRNRRQHFCGGSLVNNYWVITAAHCIIDSGIQIENLQVRIGDYDTMHTDDSEITMLVTAIHLHDGYDRTTYDGDIALIKLANPISEFTDYIRPICFPNITTARRMYRIGNEGKVTGWGQIAESGPYPRYMAEVTLPLVGKRRCRDSTTHVVTTNMFCAGYPYDSGDACRGDSGGPYSVKYQGRWYILGIVSWGEGCGEDGKYGFYTKIVKFVDWTNNYINSV